MKRLTKKENEECKKILLKIVLGVVKGTKLSKEECELLIQYMNNKD